MLLMVIYTIYESLVVVYHIWDIIQAYSKMVYGINYVVSYNRACLCGFVSGIKNIM